MKILASLALPAFLFACTRNTGLNTSFNESLTAGLLKPGGNLIEGSLNVVDASGKPIHCQGKTVYLLPVTQYSQEWMKRLFSSSADQRWSDSQGFVQLEQLDFSPSEAEDPLFEFARTALCQEADRFRFEGVGQGDFYVLLKLDWIVTGQGRFPEPEQGIMPWEEKAYLMKKTRLGQREIKRVSLTARASGD